MPSTDPTPQPDATALSARSRVRRVPERGRYDRATVDAVLDAHPVAHVAFVQDGQPFCIPMLHARAGDRLYVHGSTASRTIRALGAGVPACVTVTILDGLVLARSAFHHSANYRSAVLLGSFEVVADEAERLAAMAAFTDAVLPGRWDELRPPLRKELAATTILAMPIEEASAKLRTGGPKDDPIDEGGPGWAGVIPIVTSYGTPDPAADLRPGTALPASVEALLLVADT